MRKVLLGVVALLLCFSLVACSVDEVLTDVDLALQMTASLETAIGNVSAQDGAALSRMVAIATTGLTAIQKTYDDYVSSGAQTDLDKVQAMARVLQSNLQNELDAAHITNPATVQKVQAWVGLVSVALQAVLQLSKQVSDNRSSFERCAPDGRFSDCMGGAMSFAPLSAGSVISVPSAALLKARWEKEVCHGDKKCGKLVKPRKVKRPKK